jgi:DNA-binding Xre family transcriptional regulator
MWIKATRLKRLLDRREIPQQKLAGSRDLERFETGKSDSVPIAQLLAVCDDIAFGEEQKS